MISQITKTTRLKNKDANTKPINVVLQKRTHTESYFITKTCLYNFDPLKPHFYIIKLGFTGVYIIFLISAKKHNIDSGYS